MESLDQRKNIKTKSS